MYVTEGGQRLRVFKNRVVRRVFGPKSDEVTGEWRRMRMGIGEVHTGFW
jgi:hypothetical protein